jgi:hypothetical protein
MPITVTIPEHLHGDLVHHLGHDGAEEVAFLAARFVHGEAVLEVFDLYRVPAEGFAFQSDFHVRLTDATRGTVIRWAHERDAALIEAHAHRGPWAASFSPTDLSGLDEWVPHVRWRLAGRPYVALVVADSSFDALAWTGTSRSPEPVAAVSVGSVLLEPTGLTLTRTIRSEATDDEL